jgi:hypothetical protein
MSLRGGHSPTTLAPGARAGEQSPLYVGGACTSMRTPWHRPPGQVFPGRKCGGAQVLFRADEY